MTKFVLDDTAGCWPLYIKTTMLGLFSYSTTKHKVNVISDSQNKTRIRVLCLARQNPRGFSRLFFVVLFSVDGHHRQESRPVFPFALDKPINQSSSTQNGYTMLNVFFTNHYLAADLRILIAEILMGMADLKTKKRSFKIKTDSSVCANSFYSFPSSF